MNRTISLDDLIRSVESSATTPLDQLEEAATTARHLGELGDELVDHFVDGCRVAGHSWADIGEHMGISRQAVQKRFSDGAPPVAPDVAPIPVDERPRREHDGKYRPLWEWLNSQRANHVDVTFSDVERVLGFPLPTSSRRHQPHWHSYEGSAVVRAIVDAGWKAQRVDLSAETVTFVRRR